MHERYESLKRPTGYPVGRFLFPHGTAWRYREAGSCLPATLQTGDGLRDDGGTRVVGIACVQLLQEWQGFVHRTGFG